MKKLLTFILLVILNLAYGQTEYFGQRFNLDYTLAMPSLRNERCNSGISTKYNYVNDPSQHCFIAIGKSDRNLALAVPPNGCDRMRFIRVDSSGNVINNLGHQFDKANGIFFNSTGNSIAEFDDKAGHGGYMAIGAVTDNDGTGAVANAGSDILITRLDPNGAVLNASIVDLDFGRDEGTCIRKSNVLYQGQHTFIACGHSQRNVNWTDCFVARISAAGAVLWIYRYNFDPTVGAQITAHCLAKQLCEDADGNIYVAGTLQDNQGMNGIDGLVFALKSNGVVIWSKNFHAGSDDEFRAIRLTTGGSLIVGGFSNMGVIAPVTHNMLILNLDTSGGILYQNILRARNNNNNYTSRCNDIIEVPTVTGLQYFLSGLVIKNGVNKQMMYNADKFALGINWYEYNAMLPDIGFGLDYDPSNCPGIVHFSSIINSTNPNFSDSHIMKTSLSGKSCNYTVNPPNDISLVLQKQVCSPIVIQGYNQILITHSSINYKNIVTCNQPCVTTKAQRSVNEQAVSKLTIEDAGITIFPNPVSKTLHVQLTSLPAGTYQVSLIDMLGNLQQQSTKVLSGSYSAMDLNMATIPSGSYLLTFRRGELLLKQKIIKQ